MWAKITWPDGTVWVVPFEAIGINQWILYCAERERERQKPLPVCCSREPKA